MALPVAGFYTSGGVAITTHDFGSVEAGEFKPDSTGWSFLLYNNYGSTASDDMTSVKVSVRDIDGGTDEIWIYQHWTEIKSSSGSTGVVDDAQTVFTPVGKNKELSLGNIPSGEYRKLYARCNPPTDAAEQNVDFQLRVTYQQPATSIDNWITDIWGNGIVYSTDSPFTVSTGGSTGSTIPYNGGYALIYNKEIYYGSSGSYSIATTADGTFTLYLDGAGTFNETTGTVTVNQLALAQFTSTGGHCNSITDKRIFIAPELANEQTIATTTGTANVNWKISRNAYFVRSTAGAGTATFTFDAPEKSSDLELIVQNGNALTTGSITWPIIYWKGGTAPTMSSGANAIDRIGFYYSTGMSKYIGEGHADYSTV